MKTSIFSKRIRYQRERKRIKDKIEEGIEEGRYRYNSKHPNPISALEKQIEDHVSTLVEKPQERISENPTFGNLLILSSSLAGLVYGAIEGYNLYEERPYSGAIVGLGIGMVLGMGVSVATLKGIDYINNQIDKYKVQIHNRKKTFRNIGLSNLRRILPLRESHLNRM